MFLVSRVSGELLVGYRMNSRVRSIIVQDTEWEIVAGVRIVEGNCKRAKQIHVGLLFLGQVRIALIKRS